MEITCWGYKKSLPVAYNWSNHTSLRVIFHLERVTECHSINPGQPPPQTSNFSVANANWLNFTMREKRIAALFPAERWCKKHAGAFLDVWCERMGLFWQLMPRLSSCTCAVTVQNTDFWMPPSQGSLFLILGNLTPCKNKSSVHPMCNYANDKCSLLFIQCTWFPFCSNRSAIAPWNKHCNGPRPFLKTMCKRQQTSTMR